MQKYCVDCKKEICRQSKARCHSCESKRRWKTKIYRILRLKQMRRGKNFPKCIDCNKTLSCYGYKRCLKCWYKWHRLENHFAWIDGRSFEPYTKEFTEELKEQIRKRDNHTCQKCHQKGGDVHHIDYNKDNCNKKNLITLCRSCNFKVNWNRDYWFAYFIYIMEKK